MGQCDRPRGHSTRDKSKWIQGILLLSVIGTTHAISKPFINSSMPEMRPTFVVNFDISKVICQHRWGRRILIYQNREFPILEPYKNYLRKVLFVLLLVPHSFKDIHSLNLKKNCPNSDLWSLERTRWPGGMKFDSENFEKSRFDRSSCFNEPFPINKSIFWANKNNKWKLAEFREKFSETGFLKTHIEKLIRIPCFCLWFKCQRKITGFLEFPFTNLWFWRRARDSGNYWQSSETSKIRIKLSV